MKSKTTRQEIEDLLRSRPDISPTGVTHALSDIGTDISTGDVIDHIWEIKKSTDDEIYLMPPHCNDCGFEDWDDIYPSKCPKCHSQWIEEPRFTIR